MLQTAACSAMSAASSLAVDVIDLRVALGMGCLHCSGLGLPRCFSDAVGRSSRLFRNVQITNFSARRMKIKLIKHEVIQDCGSYEVRFPDGRPSRFFYFENLPSRRLRPDLVEQPIAEQEAKAFAHAEQDKLDSCG